MWGGADHGHGRVADMKNNRAAESGSHGAWGAVLFDVFTEKRDCLGAISQTRNFYKHVFSHTLLLCKQHS